MPPGEGSEPPSLGPGLLTGRAIRDETYGDETNDTDVMPELVETYGVETNDNDVMPELVGDTEWGDDDDDDAVWDIIDGAHRWYVS